MTAPLRTLHVDTERTWRGGEQQALYLACGLRDRGHLAEVVGHPGSAFAERAREAGLTVHEQPLRGELNPAAILRIARLLRAGRFQIIHAHTSHAHTLAALAAALVKGVRCVVSRRVDFAVGKRALSLGRLKYRALAHRYLAISACVRQVLIDGGVPPEKISVVPSGIDPARLLCADPEPLRREFGLEPDTQVVGAVAHFAWHKGLEVLIDAMPAILSERPGTRFLLVGDGELREPLEARARALVPRSAVSFPGFRKDAPSFLRLFDVVASPSVMEGLNTTNLDALALSRPVVASRVGGIPEAIIHRETGLLVPPEDPPALAQAILELLRDRELAATLGRQGKSLIERRFTTDCMVEGTLSAYAEVLRGVTRRARPR